MNRFIFIIVLPLVFQFTIAAQDINQEIKVEGGQPFLLGQIDVAGLNANSYRSWYTENHNSYVVDLETVLPVKKTLTDHHILIFMGTWCGDSKREVPRFIKILEALDFPMENMKIVAVDRRKEQYKKSPAGAEWGLNIKRVPTFIFYKNGKERNRIVESPVTSLEADIKAIVNRSTYVPNYTRSLHFD